MKVFHSPPATMLSMSMRSPMRAAQEVGHVLDDAPDIGRARIQRLAAREGQKLRGQPRAAAHRLERVLDALRARRIVLQIGAGALEIGADDLQQVVEVVSDAAGEMADRLHLLRLPRGLLRDQPLGRVDAYDDKAAGRDRRAIDLKLAAVERNRTMARRTVARGLIEDPHRAVPLEAFKDGKQCAPACEITRKAHQLEEIVVEDAELAVGCEHRDPVADGVERGLQDCRFICELALAHAQALVAAHQEQRRAQDHEQRHHRGQRAGDDLVALDAPALVGAGLKERAFLGHAVGELGAQHVHFRLALVHGREHVGGNRRPGCGQRGVERLEPVRDHGGEQGRAPLLRGIVDRQGAECAQVVVHLADAVAIGRQEPVLMGDDIAALAGFGGLDVIQDVLQSVDDVVGVNDPALLLALVHGEPHREIGLGDERQKQRNGGQ